MDEVDAEVSGGGGGGGGGEGGEAWNSTPHYKTSLEYNMGHENRGYAMIINNRTFEIKKKAIKPKRKGSDVDADDLYKRFKSLDFKVKLHKDLTRKDMKDKVELVAKEDHSDYDCFVLVVLSHGNCSGVYGTDGAMPLEYLIDPFKGNNCKTLVGKPKLFLFQACEGDDDHELEQSDAVEADAVEVQKIPTEADILLMYSPVPGYYAWKENPKEGSWFIQALKDVLEKSGTQMEIFRMLTRVNRMVEQKFDSNPSIVGKNKKQIPCITSMLTKALYFKPKE